MKKNLIAIILSLYLTSASMSTMSWQPTVFNYHKPQHLKITESQFTLEDLYTAGRHPLIELLRGQVQSPKENFDLIHITYNDIFGNEVPCLLAIPTTGHPSYPVILLAHGFTSSKEQITYWLTGELSEQGFATLALDFPYHGERQGVPFDIRANGNTKKYFQNMKQSIIDIRQLIDLAETRKELNTQKGVGLIGYSMGSWLSSVAGAVDSRIKVMVLMVGGGQPLKRDFSQLDSFEKAVFEDRAILWKAYPTIRPDIALPYFSPRPILMQNGTKDKLVPPVSAQAAFQAAKEPKEIIWYDSGHLLPLQAFQDAAFWIHKQWDLLSNK